jgi:hypothetical protein
MVQFPDGENSDGVIGHEVLLLNRFDGGGFNLQGIYRITIFVKPEVEVRTGGKSRAAYIPDDIPLFEISSCSDPFTVVA